MPALEMSRMVGGGAVSASLPAGITEVVLWFVVALILGGLIVGALGRLLHPGPDPIGIGTTILIGIAANVVVGILLHGALGPIVSFVLAVIVAALLVGLWSRRAPRGGGLRPFGRP